MVKILPKQIEQIVMSPRVTDADAGRLIRYLVTGKGECPAKLALAVEIAMDNIRASRAAAAEQKAEQRRRKK